MLAVPRGRTRLVVVAQADGPRLLGITNWVGRTIHDLHASAAGKLLLADLDDRAVTRWYRQAKPRSADLPDPRRSGALLDELAHVRTQGWAEIDGESEPGPASVAAPLRDSSGALVAMLGYSGPSERLDRSTLVAPLQRAASTLE